MQAPLDLTLDRTYRLAMVLSENLSLGKLRRVSLKWQDKAPAAAKAQASVNYPAPTAKRYGAGLSATRR